VAVPFLKLPCGGVRIETAVATCVKYLGSRPLLFILSHCRFNFLIVSILKRLRDGHLDSEAA
jgi:hypothetical protein